MSPLAAIVARELTGVARETRALSGPAFRRACIAMTGVLIGVTGTGFLLAAAHAALAQSLGVEAARMIIGAALLAVAGGLYVFAVWWRPDRQPPAPSRDPPATGIGTADLGALAVFAGAFVLARRLCRKRAP